METVFFGGFLRESTNISKTYKLKPTKEGKFITMICIPFLVIKNIHHFESYKFLLSRIYYYKVIWKQKVLQQDNPLQLVHLDIQSKCYLEKSFFSLYKHREIY